MNAFDYSGGELEVFRHARNWKAYWRRVITPYVGRRVLDVGAGIGSTAENLGGGDYQRWVELEPDPAQVRQIQQMQANGSIPASFEIMQGTLEDLPQDEVFDTILYMDVLEHIEDDQGELRLAATHLAEGGNIVVLAPAHQSLYTEFDRQIGHFRRYDASALKRITPSDLELREVRYLDCVGMLASLANKAILRSGSPTLQQIQLWDGAMVPLSRVLDGILFNRIGKSIVCIYQKPK